MQRIRPHLGHIIRRLHPHLRLLEGGLAGAVIGTGNALLWRLILGWDTVPWWEFGLIAVPSVLLLMVLAAGAQQGLADRHRPRRRAHARPTARTGRKAA